MNALKLLVAVALCIGIAGCDTNAFTEDFPDPGTEGLPPYVGFDIGQLETQNWLFDQAQNELGSVRMVTTPGTNPTNLTGLRVRLPMAIGENVNVTYSLGGNAVYGVDYDIQTFAQVGTDDDGDPIYDWVTHDSGDDTVTILFSDENPDPVQIAPHYRDVRIRVLPNPDAASTRTVTFELVSASAPSGRQINIGRFPTNRDNIATVIIDG